MNSEIHSRIASLHTDVVQESKLLLISLITKSEESLS